MLNKDKYPGLASILGSYYTEEFPIESMSLLKDKKRQELILTPDTVLNDSDQEEKRKALIELAELVIKEITEDSMPERRLQAAKDIESVLELSLHTKEEISEFLYSLSFAYSLLFNTQNEFKEFLERMRERLLHSNT